MAVGANNATVYNTYSKVKICKDLYWKAPTVNTGENIHDFISAIKNESNTISGDINIYNNSSTVSSGDSFYGIVNNNLVEFDGQNHSINLLSINPIGTQNVGLIRDIVFDSNESFTIKDFIINYAEVNGSGDTGTVIGKITANTGLKFNAQNIIISGNKVNVTKGNAAAFFGNILIESVNKNTEFTIKGIQSKDSVIKTASGHVGILSGILSSTPGNYPPSSIINISDSLLIDCVAFTSDSNAGALLVHIIIRCEGQKSIL